MRNYFKTRGMKWTATSGPPFFFNFVLYAFGGSDAQLLENVLKAEFSQRQSFPNSVFTRTLPAILWVELNSENFGTLMNDFASSMWNRTHLDPAATTVYPFTLVEAEGSPRKTWSHGH